MRDWIKGNSVLYKNPDFHVEDSVFCRKERTPVDDYVYVIRGLSVGHTQAILTTLFYGV